jgi:hypothetical protein
MLPWRGKTTHPGCSDFRNHLSVRLLHTPYEGWGRIIVLREAVEKSTRWTPFACKDGHLSSKMDKFWLGFHPLPAKMDI